MKKMLLLALAILLVSSLATAQTTKLIFGPRVGDNAGEIEADTNEVLTLQLWIRTAIVGDDSINIIGVHIPLSTKNTYIQSNSRTNGELLYPFPLWEDKNWLPSNADNSHPGYTNQSILAVKDFPRDPFPGYGIQTNGEWWNVATFNMRTAAQGDGVFHNDAFIIGNQVDNGNLVLVDYITGEINNNNVELAFARLKVETTVGIDEKIGQPTSFSLSQNYPNPFNATTTISYNLPEESDVTIDLYDIMGRKIETLVSGAQSAGTHSVVWDASNVSSGVYLYRIIAGNYTETRRCNLLK